MQTEGLEYYLKALRENGFSPVIKDFCGFTRQNTDINNAISPYCGHYNDFCHMIKSNPVAHHICHICTRYLKQLCKDEKKPFTTVCHFGVTEYNIPIIFDGICTGAFCLGAHQATDSDERIKNAVAKVGGNANELINAFNASLPLSAPSNEILLSAGLIVRDILAETSRSFLSHTKRSPSDNLYEESTVDKILRYICNNCTDSDISVKKTAEMCFCSESTITHLLSNVLNTNFRTLVNQNRIIKAKYMLEHRCNITETALQCGFCDGSYFTAVFRKITGTTPAKCRKSL